MTHGGFSKAKGRSIAAFAVAVICLSGAPVRVSAEEKFWCEDERAAQSTPGDQYCGPCVDLCDENCICGIYLC
jgi:hypothetical protein